MATLFITEYARAASGDFGGGIQAPLAPPIAHQTVSIGAGSLQSNPFDQETRLLRVHTDTACYVLVGADPTASSTKTRMIADSTEFIGVPPGSSLKIAVIAE